jgi:hypothetical protein
MFKTQDIESNVLRTLQDAELDIVTGGMAVPGAVTTATSPVGGWTFTSVFSHYVIGRYLPVPDGL